MRLSDYACQTVLDLASGGVFEVLGEDAEVLVQLPLEGRPFHPVKDGKTALAKAAQAKVVRGGRPTRFRVKSASGEMVFDGLIGRELSIDAETISRGEFYLDEFALDFNARR